MTPEIKQRIEQIRRGEVPEGYKKTKAGIMPIDWCAEKEYKAKDIFRSVTNKKHNGEFEVLSATQDKGVIPRSQLDIDIKFDESNITGYKKVDCGDFVISLRSFQGGIEYSEYEGLVSPAYTVLKPIVSICYYKAYLKTVDYISRLNKGTYGIRDGKQIGFEDFGDMILHYPLIFEQEKIAEILSAQDKLIELKEKLIEEKKKQKKALIQQLLTGKKRLLGFNKEWQKHKLREYIVEHNEKTTLNNQYPVLTSSRQGLFFQNEYYNKEIASEDNTGYNVVPRGYFTYRHMSDDEIFKFNINNIVDKGIVSTLYPVFTTKNIDDKYLQLVLNEGNEFKKFAVLQKQGGSRTYMYLDKLKKLSVLVPSIEEQKAIANILTIAENEIELLQNGLDQEKQKKKALMQLLLTGIVRI